MTPKKLQPRAEIPAPKAGSVSNEVERDRPWTEDQQRREYYYDDAHGYEVFSPDEDESDCDEFNPANEKPG